MTIRNYIDDIYGDDSEVPSRIAVAMLCAVHEHLEDMRTDDEVGSNEGFTADEIADLQAQALKLIRDFEVVLERVKR
jgi:hypothetical protein